MLAGSGTAGVQSGWRPRRIFLACLTLVALAESAWILFSWHASSETKVLVSDAFYSTVNNTVARGASLLGALSSATGTIRSSAPLPQCQSIIHDGCTLYVTQKPIPAVSPLKGNLSCVLDCNHIGNCLATKGICQCAAGWTGLGCTIQKKRPCLKKDRRMTGFEVVGGSYTLEELAQFIITNETKDTKLLADISDTLCSGECDEDVGQCYCPTDSPQGRIPPDPTASAGTPPRRVGRPMSHFCQPSTLPNGSRIAFGHKPYEELYGPKGWCVAAEPDTRCPCEADGYEGGFCEIITEQTCLNQCNGHGECMHGFCKCHAGWFGHDCAYRMEGVPDSPGLEETRPWIRDHVRTPAAKEPEPGQTRKRPLIWVYELPSDYNTLLLQYRHFKNACVNRWFYIGNVTWTRSYVYDLEYGFHEMLLQSPHRTLDPEEADFFYVPAYATCVMNPDAFIADGPYYYGPTLIWTVHSSNLLEEVQIWINAQYPYWSRKQGRDHIFLSVHDEGSCWLPKSIKNSIILSHWGRKDGNHSLYDRAGFMNYLINYTDPLYEPRGFVNQISWDPCHDPKKDMVVPAFRAPRSYKMSPLLGAPALPRTRLAMFSGLLNFEHRGYSRGYRQRLAEEAWAGNWAQQHNIWVYGYENTTDRPGFIDLMLTSTFCIAIPGLGWTSKFEEAILHGCIPVVIMDLNDPALGNAINPNDVSVRVKFKDIPRLPKILKSITPEEVLRLQLNLKRLWRRYAWFSSPHLAKEAAEIMTENLKQPDLNETVPPLRMTEVPEFDGHDAFQTVIEWLYARMANGV